MKPITPLALVVLIKLAGFSLLQGSEVIDLWPGVVPPGDEGIELPPEIDKTKDTDKLIAGRRIIKLGNVSNPQIELFRPSKAKRNGAGMIVAPGGGHSILAYDLEGTEVAEWLNYIGVTAIVLKYRVPSRDPDGEKRWLSAVQDAQRAVSLIRSRAGEWDIDPDRIGLMGFSAGGETAALTALLNERQYAAIDRIDSVDYRPNFVGLIYPGGLVPRDGFELRNYVRVTSKTPPMFMVHAHDDGATSLSSALLYVELKKKGIPAELHIFESGGHGYGLRATEAPVTGWPNLMEAWLNRIEVLD